MELIEGIRVPLSDPNDERDRMWERNHKKIAECIHDSLKRKDGMPSISHIVLRTKLNRKTVRKHIQEFGTTPAFKEQTDKYKIMAGEIMNHLCYMAFSGNV